MQKHGSYIQSKFVEMAVGLVISGLMISGFMVSSPLLGLQVCEKWKEY